MILGGGQIKRLTIAVAERSISELWLKLLKAWLGARVEGGILHSSIGCSGRWAKVSSLDGCLAEACPLDCSFVPTFCGFGFSPPPFSWQSPVQPLAGSLVHPHPNPQTHSPEQAITRWRGKDERK